jgi:hypothetical protein
LIWCEQKGKTKKMKRKERHKPESSRVSREVFGVDGFKFI